MTKNSTKRALVLSIVSLLLCVSMMMGTTFAWFTDSASSAGNKIVAGTLDVALVDANGDSLEGEVIDFVDFNGNTAGYWEPGCTFKTEQFYIKNNGNLNLKFKVTVNGIDGDAKLLEVLDFSAVVEGYTITVEHPWGVMDTTVDVDLLNGTLIDNPIGEDYMVNEYNLAPGENFGPIVITGHMDEEAGNEYQGLTAEGISVTVVATQAIGEQDSFDGMYDENATYPIVSAPVNVPNNATESETVKSDDVKIDVPADVLNALGNDVKTIAVANAEPVVDTVNKTVTFDSVELVDQNGKIIDLSANTTPLTVTLSVGDAFDAGEIVNVKHDGEIIASVEVADDKTITYTATHFCEVSISEKVFITVTFSDGYTKNFRSLKSAMRYGYSGGEQVSITVYEDITEEMDYLEGNIVCGNPKGVTIKNTIVDEWIYCDGTNFTIGEGITYDASGNASGLFVYGDNCVINGTVITDCYYQRYADSKLTINAPGSLTVKTETFILRYTDGDANAGIYVNGDNDDSTVELNLAVAYFYQGMISAKDATLKVGTYWQTQGTDGQGSANLVLDNSKMTVTVNEHNFKATGNSTVTLKNGSVLDVAGGIQVTNEIVCDETSVVKSAK